MSTERGFVRDNSLSLFFLGILLLALVGQALSGWFEFNDEALSQAGAEISLWRYVSSSQFGVDVAENWQSEFLQFFLYILVTVWLVQRGSPESKAIGDEGEESDRDQRVGRHATAASPRWAAVGGLGGAVYARSLGLVMGLIFLTSWLAQSITGRGAYNAEQLAEYQDPVSWPGYITSAEFWNRTFQNWQSEFLAVASMVALSIYLRQRGSPESKPVGTAHDATGIES